MRGPLKAFAAMIIAVMCIVCTLLAAGAAENEVLSVTGIVSEGGLDVKIENLCDSYIGNLTVHIKNPEGVTDKNEMLGFVGSAELDSVWVRSVAPGESTVLVAKKGDVSALTSATASSGTDKTSDGGVSPALWVVLGIIAVFAVAVILFVLKKKGAGKNISAMVVLCVLMLGLGTASVAAEPATDNSGTLEETVTFDGADYVLTVEYTVVPELQPEPLKNIRKPQVTDECNTPQVDERRIKEGAGPLGNAGVYVGSNDFFFEGTEINDYVGRTVMKDARLKKVSDMMNARDAWAKDNDIKLYLVIAPNKSSVYSDYVPDKITPAEKTNTDVLVEYLAENSTVEVIDLRQPLIDARAEYGDTLFYKHDTHWNNNGGFVGYSEVMRRINEDIAGAYTLTKDDFNVTEHETYMKDLAWYLGYYSAYTDFGPVYTLKNGLGAGIKEVGEYDWHGQFRYCSKWQDGYSDSLKYVTYENVYNADAPSLYMYRDSFSVSMLHFFKDSFNKSVFDWTYDFNQREILDSGADVVIMEVVEKHLTEFSNSRNFSFE